MGIKRHDAIAPLSRHHHQALVMAMKLNKLSEAPDQEELRGLIGDVASFWENGGQGHFREEEEILLPAYASYGSIREPAIIDMLLEHVQIRSLVASITKEEGDVVGSIRRLGTLLEQHVRKEERTIFPLIESALPEAVLEELKPYFHEHPPACKR